MIEFIRRKQIWAFFILAFVLSWYPWALGVLDIVPEAKGMNPLGLLVAGLIMSAIVGKWAETKAYLARIVRVRVHPTNYLIAFGLPIFAILVTVGLHVAAGASLPTKAALAKWPGLIDSFIFIFLFIGLGEEPGWRGFALPRLLERFTPITASLILGAVWTLWHFPLVQTELQPAHIAPFALNVMAGTFVLTWLFNRSRGSVFITMLMHSTINTVGSSFFFTMYSDDSQTRLWWIYTGVWAAMALLVAFRTRGTLGFNPSLDKSMDRSTQGPVPEGKGD